MQALGESPVAFWRAVHGLRDAIAFSDAIDGFTQDTVGELVSVLEKLGRVDAEESLRRAGLFLPYGSVVELTEEFLTAAARFCAGHCIETKELEAMLRYAGSVRGAIAIYVDEHVNREPLMEACAESFRGTRGLPEQGRATAVRALHALFARHILDRQGIVSGLVQRLVLAAATMGYVDPEPREGPRRRAGAGTGGGPAGGPPRGGRAWAIAVMGMDHGRAGPQELRERYRILMMRHHPDVDPAGLELCKDINVAYALLMAETGAGAPADHA